MQSILVTGGAGFIGSNFLPYFVDQNPGFQVINLDLLTYAGNPANLTELAGHPRYRFVQGNIGNRGLVEYLFREHDVRGVVHFAAESHVDNSIAGPEAFVLTNVNGTFTLIDVARRHWLQAPHQPNPGYEGCRFLHVSTDEVYGTLGATGLFTETTPYAPNSPYSASKAASDMIVRSYHHTYGLNTVTTNCSNNYGPKQHDEKLIPVIIRKALGRQPIPVYGDGLNVRDWLYVLDHGKGIALAYQQGRPGETYNIGGRNERTNLEVVNAICQILDRLRPLPAGSYTQFITFVQDRAGHDRRYAIDATKIETELSWRAEENFESGIAKTVEWYVGKYEMTG
jgi:dTDP-glucose 4,6-dehydratase